MAISRGIYRIALAASTLTVISAFLWGRVFAADDYNTWGNWRYVYLITKTTAPGANVTTTQTNFPVLLRIDPGNFDGLSSTADDGSDIRFSLDNGTHLNYERERWKHTSSTIDTAEFWVLVPSVAGNDTTKIIMYWNKSGAGDSTLPGKVFDTANGFRGVWHLNTSDAGPRPDATYMNDSAKAKSDYTSGGEIAGCDTFIVANADYDSVASGAINLANKSFTLMAWFKMNTASPGTFYGIFGQGPASSNNGLHMGYRASATKFSLAFFNNDLNQLNNYAGGTSWHLIAGTYNTANKAQILYMDGAQDNSRTSSSNYTGTGVFRIGTTYNGTADYFGGKIDEAVVSDSVRSADWIKLCYQNQRLTNGRDSLIWCSFSYNNHDYIWDNSATAGYQSGNGTWGTDSYWAKYNGTGITRFAWPGAGSNAIFGVADGTYAVSINGTQNVDSLIFLYSGYTLSGGTALNFGSKSGILVASGKTATISTAITGSGGLAIYGGGALNLGNTSNTYTGATTISAGTLQLGVSGVIPDNSAVSIANATSTIFDVNGKTETIGSLSGGGATGGNVSLGAGALTCGGDNTSTSYGGAISGSGSLTKAGTGALTLSGANSYTGITTISGGTLQIGEGSTSGAISNLSTITDNAALSFNRSDVYKYTGAISGTGTVTNAGTGVITLSGTNTYTGATTVSAGTLLINGSTASGSSVSVSSGASLGGTGTISGNVSVSGTLSPCTTNTIPGTLTIGGDLTFTSGSTYGITANGKTAGSLYDQTVATNASALVTLGGNATLSFTLGYTPEFGDSFVIIDNQGSIAISGTFKEISDGDTVVAGFGGKNYNCTVNYEGGTGNDVVVTVVSEAPVTTEEYSQWHYYMNIYVDTKEGGANVAADQLKFPLLVRLNSSNFNFNQALTTGYDIRFAKSNGDHLQYQIERWDNANSLAEIWVRIDTVRGYNNTQYFKMYWGKSDAADSSSSSSVFDTTNGFVGVYHLNGSSGNATEATVSGLTGTANGGITYQQTGDIGYANGFDGDGDYFDAGYNKFDMSANGKVTVSAWVNRAGNAVAGAFEGIATKYECYPTSDYREYGIYNYSSTGFGFVISSDGTSTTRTLLSAGIVPTNGIWYYVTGTMDASAATKQIVYVNGVLKNSNNTRTAIFGSNNATFKIGLMDDDGGSNRFFFNGTIDEVRVEKTVRSADWIKLCYETQKANQSTVQFYEEYTQWTNSKNLYLNTKASGANVSNNVVTFPVLVRLDSTTMDFTAVKDSGQDIRFSKSDGTTPLYYEIEQWDKESKAAAIWVRVDTVYGNDSTHYIKMYWGKSDANSRSNGNAVFDTGNGFTGVWHFSPLDTFKDASVNSVTLVNNGSTPLTSSIIGHGRSVASASSQYLYAADANVLDLTGSICLSGWINCSSISATMGILGKDSSAYNLSINSSKNLRMGINGTIYSSSAASTIGTIEWDYVAASFNEPGDSVIFYVNGAQLGTMVSAAEVPTNTSTQLQIGARQGNQYFNGSMDEPRVIKGYRSSDWIKLCYENQKASQTLVMFNVEDYSQWAYSRKVNINTSQSGANSSNLVQNFPALIRLTSSTFPFSQAQDDGRDIRFAKLDGTKLSYEIARWDRGNQLAEIWVLLDSVKANNGTQYIRMYWGKTGVMSKSSGSSVFATGNGFVGVWHFASKDTFGDATFNGLSLTNNGTTPLTSSIIGYGRSLASASSHYLYAADANVLDLTGSITLSAWINCSSISATMGIAGKDTTAYNLSIDGSKYLRTGINKTIYSSSVASSIGTNAWNYVTAAFNEPGDSIIFYVNGQKLGSKVSATAVPVNTTAQLQIGARQGNQYFNGSIDEICIVSAYRSADYIKLCYENQKTDQTLIDLDDYDEWSFSRQLFINTSGMGLSGNVVKFPLLIRLDTTLIDFNQARDTGKDIRFSKSDGTHFRYEIEKWDKTNKSAIVWVLVDTIKQSSGTQYIKMYWGKSNATSKSNGQAVFDTGNGFAGIWHFKEDGADTAFDATVNGNKAVPYGFSASSDVAGNIGIGRNFNGGSDYFRLNTTLLKNVLSTGNKKTTISFWFKAASTTARMIVWEGDSAANGWGLQEEMHLCFGASPSGSVIDDYLSMYFGDGDDNAVPQGNMVQPYVAFTDQTNWHFASYVIEHSATAESATLYLDGTSVSTDAGTINISIASWNANSRIGRPGTSERYFSGILDELSITNNNRSADWIKLCYETQKTSPTVIVVDSSAEMYLPLRVSTYAASPGDSLDSCIIATKKWTLKFDRFKAGGIKWLSPDSMGTGTNQLDTNLFYLLTNNHRSDTGYGQLKLLDSGKVFARLQQNKIVGGQLYNIYYTILGSAKAFVKVYTNATGDLSPADGMEFRIANNASANITNTASSATASSCAYLLHSDAGTNRIDPCLALFENWSQADAITGTGASKYYGIKSSSWSLPANRSQAWEFMIDFSHCDWNDTSGVGYRVNDYRTPDSMVFYSGTPLLEKAWERQMYGHWQFEEGAGDTTYDNSISNNLGVRPSGATWTWETGKWGRCLSLAGGNDKVFVADNPAFDHLLMDGFTICAWIKPSSQLSSSNGIFKKYSTGGYSFTGGSGGVVQLAVNGTAFPGRTNIGSGIWRHVAVVYTHILSDYSVKIFVDGKPDTIYSGGSYPFDTSNADVYIGDAFSGLIDDVRFYGNFLRDEEIKAVYQLGYSAEQGMYIVRADNNSTVHCAIDGYSYRRYFPTFQIYNYWSTNQPSSATPKVYMNGTKLTYEKDYFAVLDDNRNKLTVGFNSIINSDATRIYISSDDTLSSEITTTMPQMSWGKITSPSSHFYVKNFTGNTFGSATANQYYLDFKMGMGNTNTSNGGEIYRLKTSKISPYGTADTTSTGNLSTDTIGAFGNFLYKINSNWLKTTSKVTATPTYTVAESSIVRVVFQLNPRTIKNGSDSCVVISRLTMYPTGQMFRWDSVYAQSANIDSTRFNVYQKYVASGSGTVDTLFSGFRGGQRGADNLQDYVAAFLRYSNPSAITNTPDGLISMNSSGTGVIGVRFTDNDAWTSAQKPHQTAYYLDIGKATLVAGSMDSISRGVRNSTGASSVRLAANGAGSAVTNSTGDFNNDAFNEKEGAYVYVCDNANTAHFTLYANGDTCRFNPAFRITNYTAVSIPQYVFVNSEPKIKDFGFNAYVKKAENELVLQLWQKLCSNTDIYISYDKTLAVTMTGFKAQAGDAAVSLQWNTESEENNLGFFLYRRIKPAFLDSVSRAGDSLLPMSLDTMVEVTAPILFKTKVIQVVDTIWKQVNQRIIFGAMNGVSYGKRHYKWIDKQVYNDVRYEYKLVAVDFNNSRDVYDKYATAQPHRILPLHYALWSNYPNPFRHVTHIKFDLPIKTRVMLNVYNIQGRLIRQIIRPGKPMMPGFYRVSWDGKDDHGRMMAAGPYIYRITAQGYAKSKIMIFVK